MLMPMLIVLLFIEAYPVGYSVYLSTAEFSTIRQDFSSIGIQNYAKMVSDPIFWNAVYATLLYVAGSLAVEFPLGLALALLVFSRRSAGTILEGILMLPLGVAPIIAGTLWSPLAIWDDLNTFLIYSLGFPRPGIDVSNPSLYFSIIVFTDAWLWSPLVMLAFLSIIRSIPKEQFELADICNATARDRFRFIIFPQIIRSPVTLIVIALRAVDAFRTFEIPFAWTFWVREERLGSPIDTLSVTMYKMITSPLYHFPISYVAAIAVALFLITLASAIVILKVGGRVWHY